MGGKSSEVRYPLLLAALDPWRGVVDIHPLNHPFLDGHKRTGLVVAETFLALNGFDFAATDQECVAAFESLAAGEMTENQLGAWFSERFSKARL
jgi:prophage maintenance system killer protein